MTTSLDDIAVFVAVIEAGSIQGGAKRLGLSASFVSKRIGALEGRLSTKLLDLADNTIELTSAGEVFFEQINDIPSTIAKAEARVKELSGDIKGHLRVIIPTFLDCPALQIEMITGFLKAYPKVSLAVNIASNALELLREDFEILIVCRTRHERLPTTTLVNRRLIKLRTALFASPSYIKARGVPKHPADLATHNCLSCTRREWSFIEPSGRELIIQASGQLATNSNEVLRAATVEGLGIANSFPLFFNQDLRKRRVVRLLDDFTRESYVGIHAYYPNKRGFVPTRIQAFLETFTKFLAQNNPRAVKTN